MVEIYLFRHGEAGTRISPITKDRERGLTEAGKLEMQKVGSSLAKWKLELDVVASSPLRRARETAALLNKAMNRRKNVEEWPELSPEGSRETLYRRLGSLKPDASVLCVGHEPYLTTLVADLIGGNRNEGPVLRISLKKAGMAKVEISGIPREGGELRWLLTPKQIRKMS